MPRLVDSLSPRHLATLVQHLEAEGFDCTPALRRAGVSRRMLEWERIPLPAAMAAMQEIVRRSRRTDLGFVRGLLTQLGADHVAMQLLLSASTLRAGWSATAPLMPLVSPALRMQCRDEADQFVIELSLAQPLPYEMGVIALETFVVAAHRLLLFLLQQQELRYAIEYSWGAPPHAVRYRELRSPRVSFGTGTEPAARIRLPRLVAELPLPMADERTRREAARHAAATLQQLARGRSLASWVRHVLAHVEDQMLGLEQVAALLQVSGKTLARGLAREQVRFGELAQQVRQARADALLRETAWSIADIAHKLGYATPSNFVRSFKARRGVTPAQYRSTMLAEEAPAPFAPADDTTPGRLAA